MRPAIIAALVLGVIIGACGTGEGTGDGSSEGSATCEHGTFSECACPDGTMGTQQCAHDTSGFEPCMCGDDDGTEAASNAEDTASDESETSASSASATTGTDATSSSGDPETGTTTDTGAVGGSPTAVINHPGPEDREAGVPIPFIGVASDPEDGMLSGTSMIWIDDLEGMIGEGEQFEAALDVVGTHTVTLTATDADGNIGEASITFEVVP